MANTSSRTLRLLALLQTHRFWPGTELADRLEISPRTLRRDVDRLRELGYPVDAHRGVDGGYQLAAGAVLPPLVLDDEESIRSLLEEGLGLHGLRVTCAASSDEAARLAVKESFDVLLCDLNLGGMGGTGSGRAAAANVIKASGANKPLVIFMTGELAATMEGGNGFEGSAFLQKPFRVADVLNLLRESFAVVPTVKS